MCSRVCVEGIRASLNIILAVNLECFECESLASESTQILPANRNDPTCCNSVDTKEFPLHTYIRRIFRTRTQTCSFHSPNIFLSPTTEAVKNISREHYLRIRIRRILFARNINNSSLKYIFYVNILSLIAGKYSGGWMQIANGTHFVSQRKGKKVYLCAGNYWFLLRISSSRRWLIETCMDRNDLACDRSVKIWNWRVWRWKRYS